ncbi:hypothetical protein [Acuticoccus sp.]|uniref:hypothetical protein n=1 Tax=Acuticoccus sp. TaxID=1904378 RepID=UPI003B518B29
MRAVISVPSLRGAEAPSLVAGQVPRLDAARGGCPAVSKVRRGGSPCADGLGRVAHRAGRRHASRWVALCQSFATRRARTPEQYAAPSRYRAKGRSASQAYPTRRVSMHRNWLTGTALVAVLAATPALAQQEAGSLRFADETELQARVGEIDTDGDGSITREEYEAYLDEQGVQEQERESLLVDFDTIDANADAIVVVAELEQVMTIPAGQAQGGQQQAGTATGAATAAQVEVQQATPDVNVQQPAPTVRVDQADPTVRVAQPEPEVAVTQQQPQVEVRQPEPQVQVQQPEPTVQVEQPEAQVAVQQPQPQVAIDAPAPEVEVRQAQPQVQVEQRQPEVRVQQPEPEVNVETAEANVEVQSEEPEVVIEQAEPEVIIEKVTEAEPEAYDRAGGRDRRRCDRPSATPRLPSRRPRPRLRAASRSRTSRARRSTTTRVRSSATSLSS